MHTGHRDFWSLKSYHNLREGKGLRQKQDLFGVNTDDKDQHKNQRQMNNVSVGAEGFSDGAG